MSKAVVWTGRILIGLVTAFMLFDGVCKVLKLSFVIEASKEMGMSEQTVFWIGVPCTVAAVLYAIPLTRILGAILLTGYLGGAIATNVYVKAGAFPIVFATVLGLLVWIGPFFCDSTLRKLIPLRRS